MNASDVEIVVRPPGGRLDRLLAEEVRGLSRTRLQSLIRQGFVLVDGRECSRPGLRLVGGERVRLIVPPAEPSELQPESIPLEIVYEDENLLLVNKPAGMVVHPAAGHQSGTLVHAALAHAPELEGVGGERRPGVVHRLDRDTSGLILLAKNDRTHQWLQRQFKERTVEKVYLALVDGLPPTPTGRIEAPLGRDLRQRKRMAVTTETRGRAAQTLYRLARAYRSHSLLELRPLTGRTHQIRVHLAFLGCPVVGDTVYGRKRPSLPVTRQMLHAWRLRLRLPDEVEARTFEAPLPADFTAALDLLDRTSDVRRHRA